MTAPGEVRYDVAAADGELIGEDVDAVLARLIIGCLDGPALWRVHNTNAGLWAVLLAARTPEDVPRAAPTPLALGAKGPPRARSP